MSSLHCFFGLTPCPLFLLPSVSVSLQIMTRRHIRGSKARTWCRVDVGTTQTGGGGGGGAIAIRKSLRHKLQ